MFVLIRNPFAGMMLMFWHGVSSINCSVLYVPPIARCFSNNSDIPMPCGSNLPYNIEMFPC